MSNDTRDYGANDPISDKEFRFHLKKMMDYNLLKMNREGIVERTDYAKSLSPEQLKETYRKIQAEANKEIRKLIDYPDVILPIDEVN
jgi:hypothetical protein